MKVIYVAGKFTGAHRFEVEQNIRAAEVVGYEVAKLGAMPLIPHANTASFDGTMTPEFWYAGTLELMRRCDGVVLVPGWETSKGTKDEIAEAERLHMPVFKGVNELRIWLGRDEHVAPVDGELESVKLRLRKKLGPNAFLGKNEQYPDAPFYVGLQEHGDWKWFGAGKSWEEALTNVKKVKFQKADRSFVYED